MGSQGMVTPVPAGDIYCAPVFPGNVLVEGKTLLPWYLDSRAPAAFCPLARHHPAPGHSWHFLFTSFPCSCFIITLSGSRADKGEKGKGAGGTSPQSSPAR